MAQNVNTMTEKSECDLKFLKLLSKRFRNVAEATTEIINLSAILNLPKGTEHFMTDIHGEYEAFNHVLRNASGVIRRKINDIFGGTLLDSEKTELCTLIYYPEQKLPLVKEKEAEINAWYRKTLFQLNVVLRAVSSKYTRSKVRKALPPDFSYIIEELLHESDQRPNKHDYFNGIIDSIISTGRADDFIIAISSVIQRLTIDSLHIVGDIYDRGPGAHIIMDSLEKYHAVDIQWGNHDVLWMGAAAGCESCIANVIRISMRYANLETIEDGYGINLLPLATFAMDAYKDDPCDAFTPKVGADNPYKEKTIRLMAQMHKAIAMIQFKLEYDIIRRRPEFGMESRNLLDKIDFERGVVRIGETEYPMKDMNFPTIDHNDPYRLTDEERELMDSLKVSFLNSEKLDRHIRLMYTKGSLYKICNSNLLYHASIPMTAEGEFKKVTIQGETYSGRSLLDKIDQLVREAYFLGESNKQREFAVDFMWYLWCGPDSPLFDKDQMTTFERYFIADKATHKERKGAYYTLMSDEDICLKILHEFGIDKDEHSHIINGHIPVKTIKGETPIRANGRLLVIDGGFSKAYQPETGIAGYTLVFNSYGLSLIQHQPFESTKKAIEEGRDIISSRMVLETTTQRMHVRDTDIGKELLTQIADLEKLLEAYSSGLIAESR